jgi:hypothetical protein
MDAAAAVLLEIVTVLLPVVVKPVPVVVSHTTDDPVVTIPPVEPNAIVLAPAPFELKEAQVSVVPFRLRVPEVKVNDPVNVVEVEKFIPAPP